MDSALEETGVSFHQLCEMLGFDEFRQDFVLGYKARRAIFYIFLDTNFQTSGSLTFERFIFVNVNVVLYMCEI